jgi:hypothetical protein
MRIPGLLFSRKIEPPQKVFSPRWEDRTKIECENINLFCWERELTSEIKTYLYDLLTEDLTPIKCFVTQPDLISQVKYMREQWDQDFLAEGDAFWKDVYQISYDFLEFSKVNSGTIHLRVVNNDACNKFHTDGYKLRLFSTYIGPGSEWLPEEIVNRRGLGKSNDQIVKDSSRVKRMGTGHVSILKGEIPGQFNERRGIVHRSPPMSHSGEKRMILRIDIND